MKKYQLRVCILLFLIEVLLTSCTKEKKTKQQDNCVLFLYGVDTYSEDYVLYSGGSNPRLFFDVATGTSGPYCFEPGCEHQRSVYSEQGELIQQGCPAYDYLELSVFPLGDFLYYYSSGCLYQADRKGNNRKLITRLSKPYERPAVCCYTEEALYISYSFSYEYTLEADNTGKSIWRAGKKKEKPEVGVLRIPYAGTGEEILYHSDEFYEMQIAEIAYHGGKVVFRVLGLDRPSEDFDLTAPDASDWITEERKHTFSEAYCYKTATGDLTQLWAPRQYTKSYFFENSYGFMDETGSMELYHYDGERIGEAENVLWEVFPSTHNIVGWDKNTLEGVMLSDETGKEMKRSPLTWEDFNLYAVAGDSYYGFVGNKQAYISANDFWAGKKEGIRLFPNQE